MLCSHRVNRCLLGSLLVTSCLSVIGCYETKVLKTDLSPTSPAATDIWFVATENPIPVAKDSDPTVRRVAFPGFYLVSVADLNAMLRDVQLVYDAKHAGNAARAWEILRASD